MPFHFEWLVPGRVIAGRLTDPQTTEEVVAMGRELVRYLDSAPGSVHVVVDVQIRQRNITLTAGRDAVYPVLRHPKLGWIIIYGLEHAIVRALTDTLLRALRRPFRFVNTWDEAIAALQEADPTLPDLSDLPPIP